MIVTGQIFVREAGMEAPTKDGRKLVMLVGIVAVPSEYPCVGEHKYTVSGDQDGTLTVHPESGEDLTEYAKGQSAGGLLTQPIWRC